MLTIVNDDRSLTIVNDDSSLHNFQYFFFKRDRFLKKNNCINNGHKSLKNDRFLKRSLFVFLKFKMSGSFLKRSFFPKTKRSFLKTIEKRNKKQSFNDRFQKWLTTLPIAGNHRLSLSTIPLFIIIHFDQSTWCFFLVE